jgi:hypothetical protein
VRGLSGWTSEIRSALAGKSEELTRLAVEMYARGLSVRDIEAIFTDEAGRCVLTKPAASVVCKRLWDEYQAFAQSDLGEVDIVYLRKRGGRTAASGPAARGGAGGLGDRQQWGQAPRGAAARAQGEHQRGHRLPSRPDGASHAKPGARDHGPGPGLIAAVEQVFPASLRQRCLAHKMRNLEAKVPAERWREFGPMARAVYQASSPALARLANDEFCKAWQRERRVLWRASRTTSRPASTTCGVRSGAGA